MTTHFRTRPKMMVDFHGSNASTLPLKYSANSRVYRTLDNFFGFVFHLSIHLGILYLQVYAVGGYGSIVRVLTDRKRV